MNWWAVLWISLFTGTVGWAGGYLYATGEEVRRPEDRA
jgi:hypothetical protein